MQNNKKYYKLRKSQIDLIKCLATGLKLKEISELMNKSFNNIQRRTQLLYTKFNVHNRRELIAKALQLKILQQKDIHKKLKFKYKLNLVPKKYCESSFNAIVTPKELMFLELKCKGFSQKDIMKILDLWSYYQCKQLKESIYKKFQCNSIQEAVYIAYNLEII